MNKLTYFAVAALAAAMIPGCAGAPGVSEQVERPEQAINGVVASVPWPGARVSIYPLDELRSLRNVDEWLGVEDSAIAEFTADDNGRFVARFQAPSAPCLLVATSAGYTEASGGAKIDPHPSHRLYALSHCESGASQDLAISWLTSVAYGYAVFLAKPMAVDQATAIDRARKVFIDYMGFDVHGTMPKSVIDNANASPSIDNGLRYGFVGAALSLLTSQLSRSGYPNEETHAQFNTATFAQTAIADISYDGLLNSIGDGVILPQADQTALGDEVYRQRLATALMSAYTDTGISHIHRRGAKEDGAAVTNGIPMPGLDTIRELARKIAAKKTFHPHNGKVVFLDDVQPTIVVSGISEDELVFGKRQLQISIGHPLETEIAFHINGKALSLSSKLPESDSPRIAELDSQLFSDGPARLVVEARDGFGRSQRLERNFHIINEQPSIHFVSHQANDVVRGKVMLKAQANFPQARITQANLRIDGMIDPSGKLSVPPSPGLYPGVFDSTDHLDGPLTLEFSFVDEYGRTASKQLPLIADNTEPDVKIISQTEDVAYGQSLPVEIRLKEDNLNTVTAFIGGQPLDLSAIAQGDKLYQGALPLPELSNGMHKLVVTATDKGGHSTSESIDVTIDTVAPKAHLNLPEDFVSGSATISGNITEANIASASLRVGGIKANGNHSGGRAFPIESAGPFRFGVAADDAALAQGENAVTLDIIDAAGHSIKLEGAIHIDTIAPTASLSVPEGFISGRATISGNITEANLASASLRIDGRGAGLAFPIESAGPFSFEIAADDAALAQGKNAVALDITDAAGHSIKIEGAIHIDTIAPTASLSIPAGFNSGTVSVSGSITEANLALALLSVGGIVDGDGGISGALERRIDRTGSFFLDIDTTRAPIAEGANSVRLIVTDAIGQRVMKEAELLIDNIPPKAKLSVPAGFNSGTVNISGSITEDNLVSALLRVGGNLNSDGSISGAFERHITKAGNFSFDIDITHSSINEGTNAVRLTIIDRAANMFHDSAVLQVDRMAPQLALDPLPKHISGFQYLRGNITEANLTSARLLVAASKDSQGNRQGGLVWDLNDSGPFSKPFDSKDPRLGDGPTEATLVVKDSAGNSGERVISFTIDNTPPIATLELPEQFVAGTAKLRGNIYEANLDSATLTIDGGNGVLTRALTAAGDFEIDIDTARAPIAEGVNQVRLTVIDAAGQRLMKEGELLVDNIPPTVQLNIPAGFNSGTVTISGSITEVNLDEAKIVVGNANSKALELNISKPGAFSFNFDTTKSPFLDGANSIRLIATDAAGQSDEYDGLLRVDNTQPTARLSLPEGFVSGSATISGSIAEANLDSATLRIGGSKANGIHSGGLAFPIGSAGPFRFEIAADDKALSEGENAVSLDIRDAAGHRIRLDGAIHIDTIAPTAQLNLPEGFISGRATISGSITEANLVSASLRIGSHSGGLAFPIGSAGPFRFEIATDDEALSEGENAVALDIRDAAGHRIRLDGAIHIDTIAPTVQLNLPAGFVTGAVAVSGSITEANLASALLSIGGSVDGEGKISGALEHRIEKAGNFSFNIDTTRAPIADGDNQVRLTVADKAGRRVQEKAVLRVDNSLPQTQLRVPEGYINGAVIISGHIEEDNLSEAVLSIGAEMPGGGLEFRISAGGPFSYSIHTTDPALGEGANTVALTVGDASGAKASSVAILYIDNIPPTAALSLPKGFIAGRATISGSITEANLASALLSIGGIVDGDGGISGALEHRIDKAGNFSFDIDTTRAPVAEGANGVRLIVADAAGQRVMREAELLVDNVSPVARLSVPAGFNSGTVSISGSITEANLATATMTIGTSGGEQLEFGIPHPGSFSFAIDTSQSPIAEGFNPVRLIVTDEAGHTVERDGLLKVDNTLPTATLNLPEGFVSRRATIRGNITEANLASASLRVGGIKANGSHSGGLTFPIVSAGPFRFDIAADDAALTQGENAVALKIIDAAGHSIGLDGAIHIDTIAPTASLNVPAGFNSGTVSVSGSITEANLASATMTIGTSGGTLLEFPIPHPGAFSFDIDTTQPGIVEGSNPVRLIVIDAAGQSAEWERRLQVDNTAPTASLDLPVGFVSGSAVISGRITEANLASALLSVGGSLDGDGNISGALERRIERAGAFSFNIDTARAPIVEGANHVRLIVVDAGGHRFLEEAELRVDNTEPAISLELPEGFVAGKAIIRGNIVEANLDSAWLYVGNDNRRLGFPITVEGDFAIDVDSTAPTLADGANRVELRVVDQAGHRVERRGQLMVDNTAPALALRTPSGFVRGEIVVSGSITEANLGSARLRIGAVGDGSSVPVDGLELEISRAGSFRYTIATDSPQLGDGDKIILLTASDAAGSQGQESSRITIDNTAPKASLEAADIVAGALTVSGRIDEDNLLAARLRLGAGSGGFVREIDAAGSYQVSIDTRAAGIADGVNILSLELSDKAGNQLRLEKEITVDNTAPTISLVVPEGVFDEAIELSGKASDDRLGSVHICVGQGDEPHLGEQCRGRIALLDERRSRLDDDGGFSHRLAFDKAGFVVEGRNTLALVAIDDAGNTAVSRQGATALNGLGLEGTVAASFTVDRIAPALEMTVPIKWHGAEIAQISTRVIDGNLDLAFVCIGVDIDGASGKIGELCAGGLRLPIRSLPDQSHDIDLRGNVAGISQGRNPVSLYARDLAGHVSVLRRGSLQEPGDHTRAALLYDSIAPQGGLSFPGGVNAGLIDIDLSIIEQHLDSAVLDIHACVIDESGQVERTGKAALSHAIATNELVAGELPGAFSLSHGLDSTALADGDYCPVLTITDRAGHRVEIQAAPSDSGEGLAGGAAPRLRIDNTRPSLEASFSAGQPAKGIRPGQHIASAITVSGAARDDNLASLTLQAPGASGAQRIDLLAALSGQGRFSHRLAVGAGASAIPDGAAEIVLIATDLAGHSQSRRLSVVIDTQPPTASLALSASEVRGSLRIDIDIEEANLLLSSVHLRDQVIEAGDSLVAGNNRITIDTRQFADGGYPLQVLLKDQAGNSLNAVAATDADGRRHDPAIIHIDNTDPIASLDAIAAHSKGVLTISGHVTEARIADARLHICRGRGSQGSSVDLSGQLRRQGGNRRQFSHRIDTARLAEGECRIEIEATDRAGGAGASRISTHIDNTVPVASLGLPTMPMKGGFIPTVRISESNLASATLHWPGCPGARNPVVSLDLLDARLSQRSGTLYTLLESAITPKISCLADARHSVRLTVRDRSGNETVEVGSFVRDTSAPRIAARIHSHTSGQGHYRGSLRYTLNITDDSRIKLQAGLERHSNAPGDGNCASNPFVRERSFVPAPYNRVINVNSKTYADGVYLLCVYAQDEAGNTIVHRPSRLGAGAGENGIVIDNTAPQGWMASTSTHTNGPVSFRIAYEESNISAMTLTARQSQAPISSARWTVPVPADTDEFLFNDANISRLYATDYHFSLFIRDKAGNGTNLTARHAIASGRIQRNEAAEESFVITLDKTPPVVTTTIRPTSTAMGKTLVRGNLSISASVREEALDRVVIYLSGRLGSSHVASFDGQSRPHNISHTLNTRRYGDGEYTLETIAYSRTGDYTTDLKPLTIDNTAAVVTLGNLPSNYTRSSTTFSYSIAERHLRSLSLFVGSRSISLDPSKSAYPFNTRNVGDGEHSLKIRAIDAFGSVVETTAARKLKVDNSPASLRSHQFSQTSGNGGVSNITQLAFPGSASNRIYLQFDLSDATSGFAAGAVYDMVYKNRRNSNRYRTALPSCTRTSGRTLRCTDSSLSYADLSGTLGIKNSRVERCASTPKVFRTDEGLVVSFKVRDAAGNTASKSIQINSRADESTISGYTQQSRGCY